MRDRQPQAGSAAAMLQPTTAISKAGGARERGREEDRKVERKRGAQEGKVQRWMRKEDNWKKKRLLRT